jgi:hypothetical protein
MSGLLVLSLAAGFSAAAEVGAGIVLLAAVLTALGVIVRKSWQGFRGLVRIYHLSHRAFETIIGTEQTLGIGDRISQVERELRPNGGNSLRDAVDQAASKARAAVSEAQRIGTITEDLRSDQLAQNNRIRAMREYLERDREELTMARRGLEAAVSELLMVEGNEQRRLRDGEETP